MRSKREDYFKVLSRNLLSTIFSIKHLKNGGEG